MLVHSKVARFDAFAGLARLGPLLSILMSAARSASFQEPNKTLACPNSACPHCSLAILVGRSDTPVRLRWRISRSVADLPASGQGPTRPFGQINAGTKNRCAPGPKQNPASFYERSAPFFLLDRCGTERLPPARSRRRISARMAARFAPGHGLFSRTGSNYQPL